MRLISMIAVLGVAGLSGCTVLESHRGPLATSLQALVPHTDGDHFVYAFRRVFEGRLVDSGIQVEHVSALHDAEQFEVSLSEDGVATGRVRFRDTGNTIWLLGEDDFPRGLHLAYDPPLPYAEVPLFRGTRRAATTATVTRLSDGTTVGALEVTQIVEAAAAPHVRSALGTFRDVVSMHTTRTLQSPEGSIELNTAVVTVLGVGEIQFDGTVFGAPGLHRELACATIGGHRLGDCRNLKARVEELESAGSTDIR